MNWAKSLHFFLKNHKSSEAIRKFGYCVSYTSEYHQYAVSNAGMVRSFGVLQSQRGFLPSTYPELPSSAENFFVQKRHSRVLSRHLAGNVESDSHLDRNFLVQLWVADRKMRYSSRKRNRKVANFGHRSVPMEDYQSTNNLSLGKFFCGASVAESNSFEEGKRTALKQPPLSQSISGFLQPECPEEVNFGLLLLLSNCHFKTHLLA